MKKLSCFAGNFSIAPTRFIFQHGGEKPAEAPKPPEGAKKETPPQKAGKDAVDAANARLEKMRQEKFQERVEKVKELQKKMEQLNKKFEAMERGRVNKANQEAFFRESKEVRGQMEEMIKQFNAELGLNIDLKNLPQLDIKVVGNGLYITGYTESGVHVFLRPDGTVESRTSIEIKREDFAKLVEYIDKNGVAVSQRGVPCDHQYTFFDSHGNRHAMITIKRDEGGNPSMQGTVNQISVWAQRQGIRDNEHFFGYIINDTSVQAHAAYDINDVEFGYREFLDKVNK